MKTKYSEKLKDPRWQKVRLEVLNRDEWTCQICGAKDKTLNVHHSLYYGKPWEVDKNSLRTLCEDCHKIEKDEYVSHLEILNNTFKESGFTSRDIDSVHFGIHTAVGEGKIFKNATEFSSFIDDLGNIFTKQDVAEFQKRSDEFWDNVREQIDSWRTKGKKNGN